ncbi:gamma-glutamylcyclotransferase family protein [Halobaculum marinum]|uniref:Gamma-glutamylcyclotransferase n=1 Tax=Halobaculum marinum TaxID=3031996 RepID=A0ABD5WW16_9EURY|nr:gamma-glutamylcyclotransferase family protein [Halobaculum sp. DT55]
MDVFVYGTLTEPERVRELLDSFAFVGAATLVGLRVVEGRYPTLALPAADGGADATAVGDAGDTADSTDSGDSTDRVPTHRTAEVDAAVGGRLLRTDEVDALDAYEGVADDLYTRVAVPLLAPDGTQRGEAAVYVGDPDRLGAAATWPGTAPFPERVRAALAERRVTVRERPER